MSQPLAGRHAEPAEPRRGSDTLDFVSTRRDRYPPPAGIRDRVGGSRRRLAEPGWVLLPARLFLGATFCFAGLQKLADPHFFAANRSTSIQGQLAIFRQSSPIGALLGPISSHAVAFGVLTALAEIAVGLGTLLGLWARIAAVGGFLLSTSFFLTVSFHTKPYYYGSDIFVMVMWLPFIAVGSAGVLSLDGWLARARGRPPAERAAAGGSGIPQLDRRAMVATAGVAAAAGVLAGADAALGRRFARSGRPPTATRPTPPTGASGGSSTGTAVASAADVPVGSAAAFTDPGSGQPALVVQPSAGDFKAFNAICSHAGCTVDYNKSQQRFVCPCHGSEFDGKTGSVLSGPAPRGLTALPVDVVGGRIEVRKA